MKISTDDLALYHYETCPYCRKVREAIDRLGLDVEYRNTRKERQHRNDLEERGGRNQVPCLRIEREDGTEWMYESDDIIAFLTEVFGDS